MSRRVTSYSVGPDNSMSYTYKIVPVTRVAKNYILQSIARICPSLALKRWLYRCLGVTVGAKASIGLGAQLDWLFPQLISIGDNTIVGMDAVILTHEFLRNEYRLGAVEIGSGAVIGGRSIIMPGVKIGSGAVVGAGAVVTKDVPPGAIAVGAPAQIQGKSGRLCKVWENVGS